MAARRIGDRLRHMLEAAKAIERLAAGKTLEDFGAGPDLAAAVERYLERLSEGLPPHSPRTETETPGDRLAGCRRYRQCPTPRL